MSAVFHYFNGRGLGEGARITLCAARIPFTEILLSEREQMEELLKSERLQFEQLPLLAIDGMDLVQSSTIIRYVAAKGGLLGDDNKTTARINMLFDGSRDFVGGFLAFGFQKEEEVLNKISSKILPRYLPIFNKLLLDNGTGYLVGDRLSLADFGLFEALLATVDYFEIKSLEDYPQLKNFLNMMKSTEEMKLYLSKYRKPKNDENYFTAVNRVLNR